MRPFLCLVLLLSACGSQELTAQRECEDRGGVYHPEREECFGATQAANQLTPSATPASEIPTPRLTPRPTRPPTPRPTPQPEGELTKTQEVVIAWQREFADYVNYQVIVEVQNTGTGWTQQSAFNADYTILGPDGGVVSTGGFTYSYPEHIAPGDYGYLLTDGSDIGGGDFTIEDYATVTVDGRYDSSDPPDVTFEITDVALRAESFGDGLIATGFVTASADVTDAALAVICFADDGTVLGATWTNLLQNLSAGEAKGFETVSATPPLDPAECARVEGFASDTGF